jgi:hypothetical protein
MNPAAPLASNQVPDAPVAVARFPARGWGNAAERAAWYWTVQPATETEQLPWLLQRWRVDPVLYAIECLRVVPLPYQAQILLDLADAPAEVYAFYGLDDGLAKRQVLVGSGHGVGKTRTIAIVIHWHKDTHKFSKTLVTAPTADQITGNLWGEVSKLHRRQKERWPVIANEWDILNSEIAHRNPEFADWHVTARTARADKPEGLQGAHGQDKDDEFGDLAELFHEELERGASGGILVIAEEASGVVNTIREVLEGTLAEPGARFLGVGNLTRPDGWFAEDMDKPARYAVHTLDCRRSDSTQVYELPYRDFAGQVHRLRVRGLVPPKYWEDLLRDCGGDEDHDRFRVRVRGLKPRSAFEQIILTNWIEEAEARPPDADSAKSSPVIGLDFGLSGDKHGLGVRQGFNIRQVVEWLPKDKPEEITLDASDRAIDAQQVYKAKFIVGDSNGVGRGAMEYLARYFHQDHPELGVTVIFFNAGAKALDSARYYLRRDELWHKKGRPFFASPRAHLPKGVPGLKAQLTAPGYHEDTNKKIWVESKDDVKKRTGQGSGNGGDAVLQTLLVDAEPEKPKEEPKSEHPPAFQKHFERLRRQEELANGKYIR